MTKTQDTKTTATAVLANTTKQIEAKGYDRSEAFEMAIAYMISEDANTMRDLLVAAHAAYEIEKAA